jgi:hypothetical protein
VGKRLYHHPSDWDVSARTGNKLRFCIHQARQEGLLRRKDDSAGHRLKQVHHADLPKRQAYVFVVIAMAASHLEHFYRPLHQGLVAGLSPL